MNKHVQQGNQMSEESKEQLEKQSVLDVLEMFKENEEFDKKLFPLGMNISIIEGIFHLMVKHVDMKENGDFLEKLVIRMFDSHIRDVRTKVWGTSVSISNVLPEIGDENWKKVNKDISLIKLEDIENALGFMYGSSIKGAVLSSKILKTTGARFWAEYLEKASYNLFENTVLWSKDKTGIVIQPLMLSLFQEYKVCLYPLRESYPDVKELMESKIMALDFNDTKERFLKVYNQIIKNILSIDNKLGRFVKVLENTSLENLGMVENKYGLDIKIPEGKSIGIWSGSKEKLGLVHYISFKKECPDPIKELTFKALSESLSFNGLSMNDVCSMIDPVFDEYKMRCDLEAGGAVSQKRKFKF